MLKPLIQSNRSNPQANRSDISKDFEKLCLPLLQAELPFSEVLGFDLANASVYDGAHAVAEALLMGLRLRRKTKRVLLSSTVHPEYLSAGLLDDLTLLLN